jgi:hypothetical protein
VLNVCLSTLKPGAGIPCFAEFEPLLSVYTARELEKFRTTSLDIDSIVKYPDKYFVYSHIFPINFPRSLVRKVHLARVSACVYFPNHLHVR